MGGYPFFKHRFDGRGGCGWGGYGDYGGCGGYGGYGGCGDYGGFGGCGFGGRFGCDDGFKGRRCGHRRFGGRGWDC